MIKLSLGRDHKARKALPILRVLGYFTAAIAGLARHAVRGNDQHNPGERLHWARGKSMDHDECIVRHSLDVLDYQAWLERNPTHPDREAVLVELEHEYDARLWRAAADAQTFYETYRDAPISPSSKLPEPVVPAEDVDYPEETFDDLLQEFNAPGDPTKLPRVEFGKPWGCPWAIVDGGGRLLSTHSSFDDAESVLREMLAPPPINTPEELAELQRARGTVVLVAGPGLVDGGELQIHDGLRVMVPPEARHGFPLFEDGPECRGNGAEETLQRCGHMSSTNRVCSLVAQHDDRAHSDGSVLWSE